MTASPIIIDCSGTPPMFFQGWTYNHADQNANLYKGMLHVHGAYKDVLYIPQVTWKMAPHLSHIYLRLHNISEHPDFRNTSFIGAHCAEWYAKPENVAHFPKYWKTGVTVFLERYLDAENHYAVVMLYWYEGRVCIENYYDHINYEYAGGEFRVAVLNPTP